MRRSRPATLLPVLLASLLLMAGPVGAWGPQGHRLVAALAWSGLTPQARGEILVLLAGEPDPSLPGIANWADQLRAADPDLGKRSAPWHYVNIAEEDCQYDAARDCPGGNCVVGAIDRQLAILADHGQPLAARRQALKFVVHFVGDVHQPLHAGYGHDKGGNTVQINLDGDGSNLHRLWDSGLLNTAGLGDAAYLRHLQSLPLTVGLDAGPAEWAETSCAITVQPGLYPAGAKIDDAYVQRWRPMAEAQLRRGGARLAVLLNQALAR
ncbi:MAG: S1/P1 nuclease [Lysobacter sp.]